MISFPDTGLNDEILKAVADLGFENPTPIQAKTIPHLLSSEQDLIALAQTGTGKTAAFGLPAIHLVDADDRKTQALVLCPTRELCLQITKDLESYSKYIKGLKVLAVYGGSSIDTQINALKRGAQIVVGTPGRTKDLIKRKRLLLGNVNRVILDEADEMLSMGFKDDLDMILDSTSSDKQTLLFSATMSKEILNISRRYMEDPLQISVARVNKGADNVKHIFYMVQTRDRYEVLKRIADVNPDIYGIVFCRTRRETQDIANKLMQDGYNADVLNGDLSQAQRDEVMGRFRKRHLQILVATDVAARGLDVEDLTHVINFNLPDDSEIYTHRSGRTGRAGKNGVSIAVVNRRELNKINEIERRSGIEFKREMVPTGKDICTKQLYTLIDKIVTIKVDEKQIEPFLPAIYEKLESLEREDLIKHFVSAEFNQFLNYYKNARDINLPEKGSDRRSRRERQKSNYSRIFINVGMKNNLNPARLIGLINNGLDSGDAQIGKIEILKKFSFFEIQQDVATRLIEALEGQDFEGVPLTAEVSQENPAFSSYSKSKSSSRNRSGYGSRDSFKRGDRSRRGGSGGSGQRRNRKKW